MAPRRCLLLLFAVSLPLIMSATIGSAAKRDIVKRDYAARDCAVSPCSSGCWCPFNQWQDARLLKFGYGMTADRKAAAYWYRRAAEKGDARAAFNYGLMLIHGIGPDPDPQMGLSFLETASRASIREAWFEFGNLHRLGEHVPADHHAAIAAYRKAAERGHVRAQHALGNMYGNGQGAGIDMVTAYKWWRLASKKGHELAGHALRSASMMMTATEISLAKRAAATWTSNMKQR